MKEKIFLIIALITYPKISGTEKTEGTENSVKALKIQCLSDSVPGTEKGTSTEQIFLAALKTGTSTEQNSVTFPTLLERVVGNIQKLEIFKLKSHFQLLVIPLFPSSWK